MSGDPYPKEQQLGSQRKKYRRKVAPRKEWERILALKVEGRPCRVCGHTHPIMDAHHIIPRGSGWNGQDHPDNITPVGRECHNLIERRDALACLRLCENLTDSEYAHVIEHAGEDFMERYYRITYQRP